LLIWEFSWHCLVDGGLRAFWIRFASLIGMIEDLEIFEKFGIFFCYLKGGERRAEDSTKSPHKSHGQSRPKNTKQFKNKITF
jgi:hypothetical protein